MGKSTTATRGAALLALAGALSCGPPSPKVPDVSLLRLPSATAVDPQGRWLFVTQGNWDRLDDYSVLSSYAMQPINERWADPSAQGCQASPVAGRGARCDIRSFAIPSATRLLPSGAGNIVFDQRAVAPQGRLMIPTRHRSAVVWMDLQDSPGGLVLECGQGSGQACARRHIVDAVAAEPARLYLDSQGFDFAYLPHLLEKRMTLLDLDGPFGPSVVDSEDAFFDATTVKEREFGGGFGLAQLPCDAVADYVPRASRDCSRPFLYCGERFVHGIRPFTVAPGRKVILSGAAFPFQGHAEQDRPRLGWPTMGALWIDDQGPQTQLFVVQHEPPMLVRMSLKLDEDKNPEHRYLDALPLCAGADLMQAFDGPGGTARLALSCANDAQLWIVDPQAMRLTGRVQVGQGANEIFYESARKRLWVTNTLEHSISLVDVDPASVSYLQERLVLSTQAQGAQ